MSLRCVFRSYRRRRHGRKSICGPDSDDLHAGSPRRGGFPARTVRRNPAFSRRSAPWSALPASPALAALRRRRLSGRRSAPTVWWSTGCSPARRRTRYGPFPSRRESWHGVFSVTKFGWGARRSAPAGAKYGDGVLAEKLVDYGAMLRDDADLGRWTITADRASAGPGRSGTARSPVASRSTATARPTSSKYPSGSVARWDGGRRAASNRDASRSGLDASIA